MNHNAKGVLITYVHGALSSALSWNYVKTRLRSKLQENLALSEKIDLQELEFEYNINTAEGRDIVTSLSEVIRSQLNQDLKRLILVGHSFGGILVVEAVRRLKDELASLGIEPIIITTSAPMGGIHIPALLRILNANSIFFKNTAETDVFMRSFKAKALPCKAYVYITVGGDADWIDEPNDGVVTCRSQAYFKLDPLIEQSMVNVNHFEVLLTDLVSNKILEELN